MCTFAASSALIIPEFVTHEPEGSEAKLVSALYAHAVRLNNELTSEWTWVGKGLLPSGDEKTEQNKKRRQAAKARRVSKLTYLCSVYGRETGSETSHQALKVVSSGAQADQNVLATLATVPLFLDSSFVSETQLNSITSGSKGRAPSVSPQGVDALQLASAIEQLPDVDALQLAHLSTDDLENRLTKQQKKVGDVITSVAGSISDVSSHVSSIGIWQGMEIDQVLDELGEMGSTATQLSISHFESVVNTVGAVLPNNKIAPQPGSVLLHATLPKPVALMLKNYLRDTELSIPTLFLTTLEDLGVWAVGHVYSRGRDRVMFLPTAPEEHRLDVKTKMRNMMDDFTEQQEDETVDCTDLVVYFHTEEHVQPTAEVGTALNANFVLVVLRQARAEKIELDNALNQMLDDHERRQAKLSLAESTISSGYELVAIGASRAGSVAASSVLEPSTPAGSRWPGYGAASDVFSPPMTTVSLAEEMAKALAFPLSHRLTSATASSASEPAWLREAANLRQSQTNPALHATLTPTPPPSKPEARAVAPAPTSRDEDDEEEEGFVMMSWQPLARNDDKAKRSAPPIPRMTEDSRPIGNAFEELTHPHAPSAQILAELDGKRPAAQRSRLPAPSSAGALNEHLKRIGAEIDGEQPFEIFGEDIEEDTDEPIIDKIVKEYHDEHYRYEKWAGHSRQRWVDYLHGERLLLNDQPIANVKERMSNGQKLEFRGSTDGCPYGVIAMHVHGIDSEVSRKLVADKLVDWLLDAGEGATFYGTPLRNWARWDRVPPNVSSWAELMTHLRDSFAFLDYTAADWLIHIAAAHVFGPVLIFSARLSRAVRFVVADGQCSEEIDTTHLPLRGYVDAAQLPAASETWLRIGMLENGHFVRCRSKELKSELMLRMCDTRDVELQKQLSVDVPHAVIFQGPSKAGKSTIMNALARKLLFDSTAPAPKKGEPKGGKIEPELAVLGPPVPGSEIGRDKESETMLVNSMVIRTDDDETPFLQLLDTPGMFDTRGPLIEVVNAVSISKCMMRFKTLRIVVMVREAALDGTGEGFANTAEAMSKLFSMAGGSASAKKNVLLWINPHKPEVNYGDDGIIEEIKKMTAARPEVRDFLRTIVSQQNSRKVVHMLEYEPETAQGEEREAIVRARLQRFPNTDPDAPVTKAVFDVDGLLERLVDLTPMRNPADKVHLPLTEKAIAEIIRQADELHDYISLRCELHDYTSLLRYLDVLQALCKHMQAGSSPMQGQSKFDETYRASLAKVAERLKSTCGKGHMEELCQSIEHPMAFKATSLDSICFAMRAAAAAAVLEPHLSRFLGPSWKEVGIETCCDIVFKQLQLASEGSCQLLSDHFIKGSSGLLAAHCVFGEQINLMLMKLQQMRQHFNLEADIADGASKSFASIAVEADRQLGLLYRTLLLTVETQTKAAADQITRALDEAALTASQHLKMLATKEDLVPALSPTPALGPTGVNPFDVAANALDVIKTAEESLVYLVDEIRGVYASSRGQAILVVEKQSQAACSLIEQCKTGVVVDASTGLPPVELEQMLASLLFLLHARSSSLRKHCASEGKALMRLDACYEDPVAKVVEWHTELAKGFIDSSKRGNDSFVKSLSDFQSQVELSTELTKLVAVEKIQIDQRAVQPCMKWETLQASANDINRRIEIALNAFGAGVDSRLREHSLTITNAKLDVVESYDYKEHAKDLVVLRNAQWCDAILAKPLIEATMLNVWQAFEKHMKRLAQGEEGAITLLRKGNHMDARTLLVQIHCMEALLDEALIAGLEVAQRVRDIHDEAKKVANDVIADKCEKACNKVLDRPGPTGKRERGNWWMDIGVRDANFTDALWHLNSLLDLAKWLTASKGHNRLDGWLNLEELEVVKIRCSNCANDVVSQLHYRTQSFFAAVGSCLSQAMDEVVLELTGDQLMGSQMTGDQMTEAIDTASISSEDAMLEDVDMKAAIKVACRELKDVLQLLSRPDTYSALFSAARDQANPDSTPTDTFHDLERVFQSTYMECQINFGDEETEPVARQRALYIYSEFDRSLPSDKAFESYKKVYQSHYHLLVSAHQQAKKGEWNALHAHFASHEFNEDTYRMMVNLRKAAEADPKARLAYEAACSLLSKHVRSLIEHVMMAFSHLKHPEQSFRAQDHLVKPWNQLQAARSHIEFLNQAPGSTPINLNVELAEMVQRFENVFKVEVLQPFAKMFDLGDFSSAEGDTTFGLKRVHILTNHIQAQGGELGQVAQAALNSERDRQKVELEKVHLLPFTMPLELPEGEDDMPLNERARDVHLFLEQSYARIGQLSLCKGDCILVTEYRATHDRILKEVRKFLNSEFGQLFKDDYLNMSQMHVNYLDKLLNQMSIGGYMPLAAQLLNVQGAMDSIKMYRSLTDHQDQESFSSKSPEQQAEVIRRTSPLSKSYIGIVQEFSVAHKNAMLHAAKLLNTNPAEVPPGALEDVFAEMRARAACAQELKGIKLDMKAVADLEATARSSRATLEVWLSTNQLSPLLVSTDTRDPSRAALNDTTLFRVIQTYKSLVKLAPVISQSYDVMHSVQAVEEPARPVEEPDEEEHVSGKGGLSSIIHGAKQFMHRTSKTVTDVLSSAEPSSTGEEDDDRLPPHHNNPSPSADEVHVPQDPPWSPRRYTAASGQQCTGRVQVMRLLCAKFTETLSHWVDAPETAKHIELKRQALLRLQRWEPVENGINGPSSPLSIFDAAIELNEVLIKEGSLCHGQQMVTRPVPHELRVNKTFEEVEHMLLKAKKSIDFVDQFDPKADPPIDPKPIEMLFSHAMDELMQLVGCQLKNVVESLKQEVAKKALDVEKALSILLKERKNKNADILLQTWKYLEPLACLSVFAQLPGPDAFNAQLQQHVGKLAQQAKTAVQMSDKKDGWEKAVSMPLLHIAKFGSDIPRATAFSNEALAEVLSAAEAKFGAQGMQTLAAALREREPALGNEIISSSDAFVAVTVADFNQKTQRDISMVKKLYAEKNQDENGVWQKYDEFEREYNRLLQHCTDGLEQMDNPLAFLVEQAKRAAARDNGIVYNSQEQIPKVLAATFAWWSMDFLVKLRKRNPHLKADPNKLRRANNGQVVCILRLLGCSSSRTGMNATFKNHLAEVPTGEGKSVVIGVLATVLALYGFNVDCVCYSSMLSSRDCDDFLPMFTAFGLTDRIRYGTFDTLCEELLTENYGDLRQATRDFVSNGNSTGRKVRPPPARALVIDEVDVFCSEAFFGGAYCPVVTFQSDEIAELMKHIWANRTNGLDLAAFKKQPMYEAVLKSGLIAPGNEWLLERAVREMDKAARSYSSGMHEHIVRGGKILYKIEGRDEYGPWTFDYETNAEYLAEYDSGKLDQQQLTEGLCMYVRCGEFSYAALPSMFQHILGVTGTLDSEKLPPQMHEVLRSEIQIELFTYCPSMYHAQKRDFKADNPAYVQLAKDVDEHYHLIVDEVDSRLMPTTEMDGQRSVIIFFSSAEELHKFRDSSYFGKFREKANVLTELTASRREDRDNIIKSATRQGAVTLASRMYGRGTDFKIFDDRMEKAGGMHVLQTFFTRDLSEEVQIMGRCARQGNKGSFSLVALSASVAKDFDLTVETVHSWELATVYANLSKLRADAGTAEVKSLREMAATRLKEHNVLANSLRKFHAGDKTSNLGVLMKRYNSPGGMAIGPNGMHVIFCLDESGSMSWGTPWGGTPWSELMNAFQVFWQQSAAEPGPPMYVSVVQFGTGARVTQQMVPVQGVAPRLKPAWSGTQFHPAVNAAAQLIRQSGPANGYTAIVIFMSDGGAGDSSPAAAVLEGLAQQHGNQFSSYTVGFGSGAPRTLEQMAFANGVQEKSNYRAASVGNLAEAFSAVAKSIAPGRLG